ncbi:hypothetical protein LCGC14_2273770 [marine sediment metagenome]|uniref:Uncharacterized protein n=1 Tax=marine sediment metagenome TaxID=412755 RepID=A0A0F9FRA2_9ZZZZ
MTDREFQQKIIDARVKLETKGDDVTRVFDAAALLGCKSSPPDDGTVTFKLHGFPVGTAYVGQRTTVDAFRPEPVIRSFDEAAAGIPGRKLGAAA